MDRDGAVGHLGRLELTFVLRGVNPSAMSGLSTAGNR